MISSYGDWVQIFKPFLSRQLSRHLSCLAPLEQPRSHVFIVSIRVLLQNEFSTITMSELSYIHVPHESPMDGRLFHHHLKLMAEQDPDTEVYIVYDMNRTRTAITYKELKDRTAYLASSLLDLGLSRGDPVLLIGGSSVNYMVVVMALHRIGVQAILVGPGGLTQDKVKRLEKINLKAVVFDPAMNESQKHQLLKGIEEMSYLRVFVTTGDLESAQRDLPFLKTGVLHSLDGLVLRGKEKENFDKLEEAESEVQFDDPIVAFFTSGSTGDPKMVQSTIHSLVNLVSDATRERLEKDGFKIKSFVARPMCWSGGYFTAVYSLIMPLPTVFVPTEMSVLEEDCDFCFQIIHQENCNSILLGTALIHKLFKDSLHLKYNLDRKLLSLTGQRFPQSMVKALYDVLPNSIVNIAYGSSEATSIASRFHLARESAISQNFAKMSVQRGVEVKLVDDDNKIIPRGTYGEICARSLFTFLGYLGDPEATREAKSPTGWVYTGDIGIMDENGMIEVIGRKKEIIKRATVKIFPAEIEKILVQHPKVADAVVLGVPDQRLHEELCACVVFSSEDPDVAELDDWCREKWPAGADGLSLKPKFFLPMKSLPFLSAGKIDKKELRRVVLDRLGIKQ